ncbi:hypothetical protein TSUD_43150 [Trifolium subterraneum]|uniref:Uncharacterized protein n=1 Tax=Trifolium subterraneum TaxID=3900 RepID=A0A2Z6P3A5_TRISU|nr:hypothetical protein TSUD_43150 [Trifolium subterraneum]
MRLNEKAYIESYGKPLSKSGMEEEVKNRYKACCVELVEESGGKLDLECVEESDTLDEERKEECVEDMCELVEEVKSICM